MSGVTAHVRGGQLAITLPTMCGLPDRDWELLGRVRMRSDWPEVLKLNYIARHRDTGELARGYVIRPTRPDVIDPHTPDLTGLPVMPSGKSRSTGGRPSGCTTCMRPFGTRCRGFPRLTTYSSEPRKTSRRTRIVVGLASNRPKRPARM